MILSTIRLDVIAIILMSCSSSWGQEDLIQLKLNPRELSKSAQADLMKSSAELLDAKNSFVYESDVVDEVDGVYDIIANKYNYRDGEEFEQSEILKELLTKINGWEKDTKGNPIVKRYDEFQYPHLFQKPLNSLEPNNASQLLELSSGTFYIAREIVSGSKYETVKSTNLNTLKYAYNWALNGTGNELFDFIMSLEKETKEELFSQEAVLSNLMSRDVVEIMTYNDKRGIQETNYDIFTHIKRFEKTFVRKINSIADFSKKHITIIDFFGNCEHGDRVRSIIDTIIDYNGINRDLFPLRIYNLKSLMNNHKSIDHLLEKRAKLYDHSDGLLKKHKKLIRSSLDDVSLEGKEVPIELLRAICDIELSHTQNTVVLMFAFYIRSDKNIIPYWYHSSSKLNIVCAALNDDDDIKYLQSSNKYPQRNCMSLVKGGYSNVLINGSHDLNFNVHGMYGKEVITSSYGQGWKVSCIDNNATRTSYSTPYSAIIMAIVVSYFDYIYLTWRPRELLLRFLLSGGVVINIAA